MLSGSESGQVCVWDARSTAKHSDRLWSIKYGKPLLGVAWSPNEHLIALCAYGEDCPVLLYAAEHPSAEDIVNQQETSLLDTRTIGVRLVLYHLLPPSLHCKSTLLTNSLCILICRMTMIVVLTPLFSRGADVIQLDTGMYPSDGYQRRGSMTIPQ